MPYLSFLLGNRFSPLFCQYHFSFDLAVGEKNKQHKCTPMLCQQATIPCLLMSKWYKQFGKWNQLHHESALVVSLSHGTEVPAPAFLNDSYMSFIIDKRFLPMNKAWYNLFVPPFLPSTKYYRSRWWILQCKHYVHILEGHHLYTYTVTYVNAILLIKAGICGAQCLGRANLPADTPWAFLLLPLCKHREISMLKSTGLHLLLKVLDISLHKF